MTENYERLIKLLKELFQIDRPDLDFGIYRIMNQKREEITTFLDKDLLPQVKKAFASYGSGGRGDIQAELGKMVANLKEAGIDPDSSPKVQELKDNLNAAVDVTELENEVYSHLYNFFRRYYKGGDFISLRRYKKDVYAIPYEGEEVKLYWANADQYYIKSSENFRDYTFKLGDLPGEGEEDKRNTVHFKLTEANTELANNKAQEGKERRFVLCSDSPMLEEGTELFIRFEYKPLAKKQTQKSLNEAAVKTILGNAVYVEWIRELARGENNTSILEKHLNSYTAKNSFDYFIHKDLGGFLRRELDFFIKNEVLHLDDIEEETASRVEQCLGQIKVLRQISHKLIRFLEHLENFQKKLWLKKKFVVEANYCITLDRVPEEFYPEICANDAQRKEWLRLFKIDKKKNTLCSDEYTNPLQESFLKQNKCLVLDTRFFQEAFKKRLLSCLEQLDTQMNGLAIKSDNFHALQFIGNKYANKINSIYIDPPYNTDASSILYKNDYKESSWATLLHNRISSSYRLLSKGGSICVAIDDEEVLILRHILQGLFIKRLGVAVVRSNPQSRKTKGKFAPTHEYALFYGKSLESNPGVLELTEERLARYPLKDDIGNYAWMNFIRTGNADLRIDRPKMHYPVYVTVKDELRIPKMHWDNISTSYIIDEPLEENETAIYPVVESDEGIIEKRWHRGFERVQLEPEEYRVRRDRNGSINIDFKTRIDSGSSPSTWWNAKEYASANYGAAELKNLFGENPFDFPKSQALVQDCLRSLGFSSTQDIVLDFFAGSGTTAHALISLNRTNKTSHKYILAEIGAHFEDVLIPRICKSIYSKDWKEGKPSSLQSGVSHCFKYLVLESYEDCLNNLEFKPIKEQHNLLAGSSALKEEYMLSYMMDIETGGSASLLNVDRFDDPWNYTMKIATGSAGETRTRPVDLVETFNYLIGLTVIRRDFLKGVEVIEGSNPEGENVLVIWRNTNVTSNEQLDEFFRKQEFNPRDSEFDLIYVNGDNNLENLKKPDETWKVRLIEEDFKRLMFEVEDV